MKHLHAPTLLVILDGLGYNSNALGNAINAHSMPNLFKWMSHYPATLLHAAGKEIGLLPGYIGNSEVGHQAIGTGRIIPSALRQMHDSIENKSLFTHPALVKTFAHLKNSHNSLHLLGLLSDAGVHSHEQHLYALLRAAAAAGVTQIFVHAILDGRDVAQQSAALYIERLEKIIAETGAGRLGSIHGRFYAMDRDKNWERTKESYDALCMSDGASTNSSWQVVVQQSYADGNSDEFVKPVRLTDDALIKADDSVIFVNFRADRAQQLAECFLNDEFEQFTTSSLCPPRALFSFITPVRYNEWFASWDKKVTGKSLNEIFFEKKLVKHTLINEVVAHSSYPSHSKVFVIAETEKYAHVTYFFNGGSKETHDGEEQILIPSFKTRDYIHYPQMSAPQITDAVIASLQHHPAQLYVINYANLDMVGHSGNFEATLKAATIIDEELGKLYEEVIVHAGGTIYITGDHGNAEAKIDPATGSCRTAHTANPVPFVMIKKSLEGSSKCEFESPTLSLANIAPTILYFMHLKIPSEMEQEVIFKKES